MRCLTLARGLADEGWRCGFARRSDTLAQIPFSGEAGFDLLALDANDGEPEALRRRWPDGVDMMVVDHYGLDAEFERRCHGWAGRTLAIDDLADRPHDVDFLLDQTNGRAARDYDGLVPDRCHLMLGAAYALLRPEFAALRDRALARRRKSPPLRRVLVSLGASDPNNFTAVALKAVARSGLDVDVDVVLSSGAPHLASVRKQGDEMLPAVNLHTDISAGELAALLEEADMAIGSGGIASWERCCLGLPSLVVLIAENQRFVVDNLARGGAVELLGDAADVDADRLAEALAGMAADGEARREMGLRASEICDGRGAGRVVRVLTAEGR